MIKVGVKAHLSPISCRMLQILQMIYLCSQSAIDVTTSHLKTDYFMIHSPLTTFTRRCLRDMVPAFESLAEERKMDFEDGCLAPSMLPNELSPSMAWDIFFVTMVVGKIMKNHFNYQMMFPRNCQNGTHFQLPCLISGGYHGDMIMR